MATIGYRLTVYDGPLYYTGSTVLTPAPNSSHSSSFQITSFPSGSVYEYAPYLRLPQGTTGEFSLETARSSIGTYAIEMLDARTVTSASNNENRWITAFIGDATAKLSIIGKKAFLEETIDSGSTWNPFFIGRINNINLTSPLTYTFEIGDALEILKQKIFSLPPDVNYVSFKTKLPVGGLTNTVALSAESYISASFPLDIQSIRWSGPSATDRWITVTSNAINRPDNFWLKGNGTATGAAVGNIFGVLNGQNKYRCIISSSTGINYYQVDFVQTPANISISKDFQPIQQIRVVALPTNDPQYVPISTLPTSSESVLSPPGTTQRNIIVYRTLGDTGTDVEPFYLNTTPYQLIRDICDGKFFAQTANTAKIPYNSASLAALETGSALPTMLFRIEEPMEAVEFIEKHICLPYSLGYTFDSVLSESVPVSQIRFFSTKQPTSLAGIRTLDASDIVSNQDKSWASTEPLLYVRGNYYTETRRIVDLTTIANDPNSDTSPTVTNGYSSIIGLENVTDSSYKALEIEYNGIRGIDAGANASTATINNISATAWAKGKAEQFLMNIYSRRKSGNPRVQFKCVRNSNTEAIKVGDFVLVNLDVLPNQATRIRGGIRLYQVVQRNPEGLTVDFLLADSGVNETMTTPTLGTVTSPQANTATFNITTTQSASVEIEYAVVNTGDSAPAQSSAVWLLFSKQNINNTTQTITISNLPEGRRIFIRVRATSGDTTDIKLPSAYAVSAGTILTNINAPTNVSVTNITERAGTVSWTNTNTFYAIQVYLANPAGTPNTFIIELPRESTTYRLTGLQLNSSTSNTVGIRYTDAYKGFSPFASASFTAAGTAPQLDAPAANILYIKGNS